MNKSDIERSTSLWFLTNQGYVFTVPTWIGSYTGSANPDATMWNIWTNYWRLVFQTEATRGRL